MKEGESSRESQIASHETGMQFRVPKVFVVRYRLVPRRSLYESRKTSPHLVSS